LATTEANGVGGEETLIHRPGPVFAADWSGDGQWVLAAESSQTTKLDLMLLAVTPDGKLRSAEPIPYMQTPFNEDYGRFSPGSNPRWVAFQSDESGHYEVYIDTFPKPRGKIRVSTAGGSWPQWGPGGDELFYLTPDSKLMAVSLKATGASIGISPPRELFRYSGSPEMPFAVSRDGQTFLLATHDDAPKPLTVIVNWPALFTKQYASRQSQ
jgi:Tol biopolymer transport system component